MIHQKRQQGICHFPSVICFILDGRAVDTDTHQPQPGVNVFIIDSNPLIGTTANSDGFYLLKNIPVGRYSLGFRFIGYEPAILKEINAGSAKEVVLNVDLKERLRELDEVVAKPSFRKNKAKNDMAFSYTINKENKAHIFALQGKNILMQSEMFGWAYDYNEKKLQNTE